MSYNYFTPDYFGKETALISEEIDVEINTSITIETTVE